MDPKAIRLSIQTTIQVLGAPVMEYSSTHANIERANIIDKAVARLFALLREMEEKS